MTAAGSGTSERSVGREIGAGPQVERVVRHRDVYEPRRRALGGLDRQREKFDSATEPGWSETDDALITQGQRSRWSVGSLSSKKHAADSENSSTDRKILALEAKLANLRKGKPALPTLPSSTSSSSTSTTTAAFLDSILPPDQPASTEADKGKAGLPARPWFESEMPDLKGGGKQSQ